MVGFWTIFWIGVSAVVSIGLPVAALLYLRNRVGVSWPSFLVGVSIFIFFALVMEGTINRAVLVWNPHAGQWFSNSYLYALYGGLMAAVFEEGGRYFGYKVLLRRHREWKDGVSYGIGHGGTEALLIGGVSYVSYFVIAILINTGVFSHMTSNSSVGLGQITQLKTIMMSTPAALYAIGGLERVMAFAVQIGLSLIVLYAVRTGKAKWLGVAIFIHTLTDFFAALAQRQVISLWTAEVVAFLVAIGMIVWIVQSWRAFHISK